MTLIYLSAALLAAASAAPGPAGAPYSSANAASPARAEAQADEAPKIVVSLTSGLVKVGEPVAIRVDVTRSISAGSARSAGGVKFGLLPEVEGIEFGRWQSLGTGIERIRDNRGRTVSTSKASYLIEVKPAGAGEYVIPPISMTIDGDVYVRPIEGMELKIVEDLAASDLLFMERQGVPERVFEGEPYTVEIEWGWDAALESDGLNLRLPWYGRQDGVVELEAMLSGDVYDFPAGRSQAIKVVGLADTKRDGRRFRAFQFRRRFVATRPGKVEFSRSIFEFAPRPERGSRFIRGRTRSYYRPLDPFSIEVLPVPDEGRPISWTGAVGTITASREALNRDVDAGEPIDFVITFEGEGNLEFFPAPDLTRLPAFDGFRVLGVDDEKGAYQRVIKYDLVPLDATINEVPPVPLSVFDTESETYVELRTDPLPIRVRAVEGAGDDPFGAKAEVEAPAAVILRDIEARPAGTDGGANGWWGRGPGVGAALVALLLSLVGWILMRKWVRAHGDPDSAVARRKRKALRALERGLSSSDPAQQSATFEAFLAARTDTEPGEWIGQGELPSRIVEEGSLSKEVQESYGRLRRQFDAAVFGGQPAAAPSADEVRAFARLAVKEGL